jgi:DNA-binding MltR family transcriptional regulator
MKLKTLADLRELLGHLPAQVRRKDTWRHVEAHLAQAAQGGNLNDMSVALQLVFSMEGIECDV